MKDGGSLDQPIEGIVADKLAQSQHDEWVARRHVATEASIAEALAILDRSTGNAAITGDELPKGDVSVKRKYAEKS